MEFTEHSAAPEQRLIESKLFARRKSCRRRATGGGIPFSCIAERSLPRQLFRHWSARSINRFSPICDFGSGAATAIVTPSPDKKAVF
jgi:hypothetical protein